MRGTHMTEATTVAPPSTGCNACWRKYAFASSSCHSGSPTRNSPRKSALGHLGRQAEGFAAMARGERRQSQQGFIIIQERDEMSVPSS